MKRLLLRVLCFFGVHVGTVNHTAYSPSKTFYITSCPVCQDYWVAGVREVDKTHGRT
jgi:hypothetical protein